MSINLSDDFDLTSDQLANYHRFKKNLPKEAGEIRIITLTNGGKVFQADVPARNIPGSYATYEKQIDSSGKTISYTKITYSPDGNIVHVKQKYP